MLLVLAMCALSRVAALVVWRDPPLTHYSAIAENLVEHGRYAVDGPAATHIEPLCPAVFAVGRMLFGSGPHAMRVLPVAAAALAGVALFRLTRRALGNERGAWIATALYAVSPYLVRQSASLMEVTLATAVLVAAVWCVDRIRSARDAAMAGLLLGAAVLTRFSYLPIALGGLWLVRLRAGPYRAAIAGALAIACVAPWMVYSYAAGGTVFPARIGENLFVSTNEWRPAVAPRGNVDVLVSLADDVARDRLAQEGITRYGMAERDRALLEYVRNYARAHPLRTMMLKVSNLPYVLQPRLLPFTERVGNASVVGGALVVPEQRRRPLGHEVAAAVFQSVLLLGTAIGVWKRRRQLREDAFLLIVLGSVVGVCVIFYPTSRLLAPASFVLMFYTGRACAG